MVANISPVEDDGRAPGSCKHILMDGKRRQQKKNCCPEFFLPNVNNQPFIIIPSLSAPTKIEELCSSIFVGAEREGMIRNDPDKSEFTIYNPS